MKTHFIVQTSSAHMPTSCWGRYGNVAVLEVEAGREHVSMISERARGCIRIVKHWGSLNIGRTEKCAYRRALAEAQALAAQLNGQVES